MTYVFVMNLRTLHMTEKFFSLLTMLAMFSGLHSGQIICTA